MCVFNMRVYVFGVRVDACAGMSVRSLQTALRAPTHITRAECTHPHPPTPPTPQVSSNTDADLYGRQLVRAVIEVKWESYARAFLLMQVGSSVARGA
jgi:hypothetical protein